jgi:hypothetical protein
VQPPLELADLESRLRWGDALKVSPLSGPWPLDGANASRTSYPLTGEFSALYSKQGCCQEKLNRNRDLCPSYV